MGMMISSGSSNKRVISLKRADGTVVGTISYSSPAKKKKKRLQYNFKEISSKILASKTSGSARRAVTSARAKVVMLQKQLNKDNYDDRELRNAIIHASKMERIARKRMKHLKEEESAKKNGSGQMELEEDTLQDLKDVEEENESELSREELEAMMQEFQELMKESLQESMEKSMEELEELTGLEDLTDELTGSVKVDMDPEDLEQLKKKHRAEELREIMDADMKYLRALFDKLQNEKQQGSSGVSLQLDGMEMPVEVTETPVMIEGGNLDVSV